MESGSGNLIHMLEERVRSLADKGEWEEAFRASDGAVKQARQILELEPDEESQFELSYALEVKADLHRERGELKDAYPIYDEAIELLGDHKPLLETQARLNSRAAICADISEDLPAAARHYQQAIRLFESLDPPSDLDVADLSNNLAFLLKSQGEIDQAEELYLKALKISHDLLGKEHEQTATLCNNIGALYTQANFHNRAREMHSMALETRRAVLGEDHPDTAQSYANLAIAMSETNEFDLAEENYEKALEIFRKHPEECAEDLEVVEANFSYFKESRA